MPDSRGNSLVPVVLAGVLAFAVVLEVSQIARSVDGSRPAVIEGVGARPVPPLRPQRAPEPIPASPDENVVADPQVEQLPQAPSAPVSPEVPSTGATGGEESQGRPAEPSPPGPEQGEEG